MIKTMIRIGLILFLPVPEDDVPKGMFTFTSLFPGRVSGPFGPFPGPTGVPLCLGDWPEGALLPDPVPGRPLYPC